MNKKLPLTVGFASLALAVSALAQTDAAATAPVPAPADAAVAPAAAPAPAHVGLSDDQLVEEFGWFIAKRVGLPELQFSPTEADALTKGFATALKGGDSPYDLQAAGPQMDALMQRRQGAYLAKVKSKNSAETNDFLAKLKDNKAIIVTPSGLRYEIVKPGLGEYPKATDTVTVNYTGKLINGTVFDSSDSRGKPAEFQLDQVIAGWTEGIQKINKGGKIRLYIPAELAYGDQVRPGIPPGSTLVFDVELVDVKAAAAAPAPALPAAPAPSGN
jgi:FKBP-type peptidyl-prolyl cis-trans isomerase